MQYIYKTLGTPKPMDYPDFDLLPLAQYYGRHIVVSLQCLLEDFSSVVFYFAFECSSSQVLFVRIKMLWNHRSSFLTKCKFLTQDEEDNKLRESRSRAHKALKDLCPAALFAAYSYSSVAASNSLNNRYVLQSFHALAFFINR